MKKVSLILTGLILMCSLTACSENVATSRNDSNSYTENSVVSDPFTESKEEKPQMSPEKLSAISTLDNLTLIMETYDIKLDKDNEDNPIYFDYYGGKIKICLTNKKNISSKELPSVLSDGWYVTLNGVLQNISVNGKEQGEVYIHRLVKDKDYSTRNTSYSLEIEFEPIIAESDKNENQLELSLVKIEHPDFEVNTVYPECRDLHSNVVIVTRIVNVNSEIKTKDVKKSDFSYTEELLTKEIKDKYPTLNESFYDGEEFSAKIIDENSTNRSIEVNEKGEIKLGAVVAGKGHEKLRLLFLVNGIPSKLSDGSEYIEIDAREGYLYSIKPDKILDVELYDSVNVFVTHCPDERKNIYLSMANYPPVLLPYNYYGK